MIEAKLVSMMSSMPAQVSQSDMVSKPNNAKQNLLL